jgi:excinuclease ABC subunit A
LSGGEAQRLKLVSELSTASVAGTLYVMDEPTTGLHRNDVHRLLSVLHALVDQGSTVVVIEHQPDVILAADWVLDLGPEGGRGGGSLVVAGTPDAVMKCPESHTGRALIEEIARVNDARKQR